MLVILVDGERRKALMYIDLEVREGDLCVITLLQKSSASLSFDSEAYIICFLYFDPRLSSLAS